MRGRRAPVALALLFGLLLAAGTAQAQTEVTLVSNTGQTTQGTGLWFNLDGAQAFTTGSNAPGYTLTKVDLVGTAVAGTPTYTVDIRPDSNGEPGANSLGTLTNPSSLTVGLNTFTATGDGIELDADTTYWLMIDVSSNPSSDTRFAVTFSPDEDSGAAGWSIANKLLSRSFSENTSWPTPANASLKLAIHGHILPPTPPTLQSASVTDKTLTLTYSEELDTRHVPTPAMYEMWVGAQPRPVSTVAVRDNTVSLTLATAVAEGDRVRLTYQEPPGTGRNTPRLRDLAGELAAYFELQKVTNAATNQKPTFSGTAPGQAAVAPGASNSFTVTRNHFSDPDGDTLTFSVSARYRASHLGLLWSSAHLNKVLPSLSHTVGTNTITVSYTVGGDACWLANFVPRASWPLNTVVTLTASDPAGATVTVEQTVVTAFPGTCPALSTAEGMDNRRLILTYNTHLPSSVPPASEFTVTVDEHAVAPTAATRHGTSHEQLILTLPQSLGRNQTVTVSHVPGANPRTVGFIDEAVSVTSTNRAPVYVGQQRRPGRTPGAPPVSQPVNMRSGETRTLVFSDPDGDPLTIRARQVTTNRGVVITPDGTEVSIHFQSACQLRRLNPQPPASFETDIIITATDTAGAVARMRLVATMDWDPADCPTLGTPTVDGDGTMLTLPFSLALDPRYVPDSGDFRVQVNGREVHLADFVPAFGPALPDDDITLATGTDTLSDSRTVTTLTLTFSDSLSLADPVNPGHVPPASAFAVRIAGTSRSLTTYNSAGCTITDPPNPNPPDNCADPRPVAISGGVLVLTLNEEVTGFTTEQVEVRYTPPARDKHPLRYAGRNPVVVAGNTVTLNLAENLAEPVADGACVRLTYTASFFNPLRTEAGDDVENFSRVISGNCRPPTSGGGGGNRGGNRGSGQPQDDHGNSAAQATVLAFRAASPFRASAAGQLDTATDSDYFTLSLPRAGVFVVETSGDTATQGTVWQAGQVLARADSGGPGQNFRVATRAAAGPVVVAVRGTGQQTGRYRVQARLLVGTLENPGAASFQSGIGLLSGWVCEAETVTIEIETADGEVVELAAAYGTERADTATICGGPDTGFGVLFNWNLLSDGEHEVVAVVDGIELGRAAVTVTTLGTEFVEDGAGACTVENFPRPGGTVRLVWQTSSQNFVPVPADAPPPPENTRSREPGTGMLENPGSFQSGIGLISGWVCEAEAVTIEIEQESGAVVELVAAHGTERADTVDACGDTDNGFGLLFNWNLLGDGEHTVMALADGLEVGWVTVRVTTLGEEFVRGAEGTCVVADFPTDGETVTLEWQESQQNFVITGVD